MDAELLGKLDQIIGLEEKFLPKFAAGTSQRSLLRNRIQALRTARKLISEEGRPAREELEFALPRIESIIRKASKARDKYEPGSRNYRRFDPTVRVMEQVRTALLRELEG
jgi:hypothetical protein